MRLTTLFLAFLLAVSSTHAGLLIQRTPPKGKAANIAKVGVPAMSSDVVFLVSSIPSREVITCRYYAPNTCAGSAAGGKVPNRPLTTNEYAAHFGYSVIWHRGLLVLHDGQSLIVMEVSKQ